MLTTVTIKWRFYLSYGWGLRNDSRYKSVLIDSPLLSLKKFKQEWHDVRVILASFTSSIVAISRRAKSNFDRGVKNSPPYKADMCGYTLDPSQILLLCVSQLLNQKLGYQLGSLGRLTDPTRPWVDCLILQSPDGIFHPHLQLTRVLLQREELVA